MSVPNEAPMNCPECGDTGRIRVMWGDVPIFVDCPACRFEPCGEAPVGIVTNCRAMDCENNGCAMSKTQEPVSLDDLTADAVDQEQLAWEGVREDKAAIARERAGRRTCVACPEQNPDCEHPTCPRWPQPGHFYAEAAALVGAWETDGKGYLDLEWRIAGALAKAATR